MKTNITLVITLFYIALSTTPVAAQKRWSAGIRAGIEITNYQITTEDFRKDNFLVNKQAFLNKRMGKRFEMELTLNHNNKDYHFGGPVWGSADSFSTVATQNSSSLGISGKYYLYVKGRLSLYGTIGTTFAYISDKQNSVQYQSNCAPQYFEFKEGYRSLFHRVFFGAGVNYNVTQRIYLNASMVVSYKLDGINHPGGSYYNRWTNGVLLGAGYTF